MHAIALAALLTLSQVDKPRFLLTPEEQEQLLTDGKAFKIQIAVSIGLALLFGLGIGVGLTCMQVWNAPHFQRALGVCGR